MLGDGHYRQMDNEQGCGPTSNLKNEMTSKEVGFISIITDKCETHQEHQQLLARSSLPRLSAPSGPSHTDLPPALLLSAWDCLGLNTRISEGVPAVRLHIMSLEAPEVMVSDLEISKKWVIHH